MRKNYSATPLIYVTEVVFAFVTTLNPSPGFAYFCVFDVIDEGITSPPAQASNCERLNEVSCRLMRDQQCFIALNHMRSSTVYVRQKRFIYDWNVLWKRSKVRKLQLTLFR